MLAIRSLIGILILRYVTLVRSIPLHDIQRPLMADKQHSPVQPHAMQVVLGFREREGDEEKRVNISLKQSIPSGM